MRRDNRPSNGDVLITVEEGAHFLSVVPFHHRLIFSELPTAIDVAQSWAAAERVRIWLTENGHTLRVPGNPKLLMGT